MICLAMHKLSGWLYSIMPNKVKPEIRDKVIQYQEECDDVLYEYWTTGEVKAKHKSTVQERNPLKNAVNLLVSKKGIMYPEAYSLVHQQFNVSGIDELTADQIPMAVEYVHKLAMEGEYIPKQDELPLSNQQITNDELSRLLVVRNRFDKSLSIWKDNLCRNLIRMDVPSAVLFNQAVTDAISELRFITDKLSERLIA